MKPRIEHFDYTFKDGYSLKDVRIVYNSKLARFLARFTGELSITLVTIYSARNTVEKEIIDHEVTHVRQWKENGIAFPVKYLWENLTKGYNKNKYEQAARRNAGQPER